MEKTYFDLTIIRRDEPYLKRCQIEFVLRKELLSIIHHVTSSFYFGMNGTEIASWKVKLQVEISTICTFWKLRKKSNLSPDVIRLETDR